MSPSANTVSVSPQAWARFAHCVSSSSSAVSSSEAALARDPFEASHLKETRNTAEHRLHSELYVLSD